MSQDSEKIERKDFDDTRYSSKTIMNSISYYLAGRKVPISFYVGRVRITTEIAVYVRMSVIGPDAIVQRLPGIVINTKRLNSFQACSCTQLNAI